MRADLTQRPIAVLRVAILNEAIQLGIDVGEFTKIEIAADHVYTFVTLDSSIVKFKQKKSPEQVPGSARQTQEKLMRQAAEDNTQPDQPANQRRQYDETHRATAIIYGSLRMCIHVACS